MSKVRSLRCDLRPLSFCIILAGCMYRTFVSARSISRINQALQFEKSIEHLQGIRDESYMPRRSVLDV